MYSFFKSKDGYSGVEHGDYEEESKPGRVFQSQSGPWSMLLNLFLLILSSVLILILAFGGRLSNQHDNIFLASSGPSWVCQQPTTRREWRILSEPEKLDYVRAVKCLATKPSKLRNNGSLYDDFPWVHKHLSDKTHVSAAFLPWHRQYIHLYEKALREECAFDSDLPYWDWSLDWSNFQGAPIWDTTSGLGGDGSGTGSVGNGKCVTSGPFSDIEVMFYDGEVQPHCLSRGFPTETELRKFGQLIRPDAIKNLKEETEFESFASELEKRAHTFLTNSVRGDLSRFTGPNDPVFFLHHANIDRLWSQWQEMEPRDRLTAYNGKANKVEGAADLTDTLDLGGLSRNVQVADVMDTTGGHLCYRY